MDSVRWQKVQSLFHEAADLPIEEQRGFLDVRCCDDPELANEVLTLLREDALGESLLDSDVGQLAHEVFDTPSPGAPPFKKFGPYRIIRTLGEGGMGIVYLAERADLGSQVAIKVLRDAWLSPARRARFAIEQRTLAQLNHPSIARLYDADTAPDGTPFFAMEYVEGAPLSEYCREHGCTLQTRLALFREVCESVIYAHQHTVIHRDLKPSNILVKSDGTVRLLDFGIAKHLEHLSSDVDQTMTSLRLMTPAYASPEQIRGEQVGVQSDVYSLGVVLYELLTDCMPHALSNLPAAAAEKVITEQEPIKPSVAAAGNSLRGDLAGASVSAGKLAWADLDVLCLTAIHKDVSRRYQSVEALARDVDHFLRGEPLEARPDTLGYRLRKSVTRNRDLVIAACLVATIVIAMVAFFAFRLARARNAALAESARAQRIQKFMTNLFQAGDAAAGPADDLRAVTLLDRGVVEAQSLQTEPAVQADLYETLGTLYQKLGKFDQADSLLRGNLELRKSLYGQESVEVAQGLIALGRLRVSQARLDEAEHLIRQGLDLEKKHLPPSHPVVAKGMIALGELLAQRGRYENAIQTLEEAVLIDSGSSVPPADLAESLSALAGAQYSAGHYDISNSLYHRVLDMDRQLHGEHHPLVANDLGSLGSIQQDLGYYSEAEKFHREALEISQSYYGQAHPKTANILTMLGRALLYQKKYDEAQATLLQALGIQEKVFGPVHPEIADTLNELGNLSSMRNDYDDAEARFARVADIYRSVYGDHHYLVAIALSNAATIHMDKKDYVHAEPLFRDVIRRFTETLSADNVNTGIARIKLGRTLLRQNRYPEAERETLAGYQVLSKQTSSSNSFLQAARKDLAADYDGMNQPLIAARFRAEYVDVQNKATASASPSKR